MSGLIEEVLAAHGGLERWRRHRHHRPRDIRRPSAGALPRKPHNVTARVRPAEQHAVFDGFPSEAHRAVFDRGDVRIESRDGALVESRRNARAAFAGLSGLRRNLRWDALDATYFAGYAWWNYLSTPILLAHDGVTITEGDVRPEAGEQWRRLNVDFPADIHTHSHRQTFYVDPAGLIRRHDYTAQPVGRWAHAAHYCSDHRRVAGLVVPARRRVHPRGPGSRSLRHPILVALDIDHIEIETSHAARMPPRQATGSPQSV